MTDTEQQIEQPPTTEERQAILMEEVQAAFESHDVGWYQTILAQLAALEEEYLKATQPSFFRQPIKKETTDE